MKELENLKELYLDEIKRINKKGELTPADAAAAKEALEAIEKIDDICCSYEEENHGYSERMYPRSMNRSYNYSMPDMRYSRRGRNSLGQYASRHDGMDETVKHMVHKLEDLRMDAPDELTRKTIDEAISKLEMY